MIRLEQSKPTIPDFRIEIVGKGLLNVIYKNAWITPTQYQSLKDMLSTDVVRGIKALSDTLVNLTLNVTTTKTRKEN